MDTLRDFYVSLSKDLCWYRILKILKKFQKRFLKNDLNSNHQKFCTFQLRKFKLSNFENSNFRIPKILIFEFRKFKLLDSENSNFWISKIRTFEFRKFELSNFKNSMIFEFTQLCTIEAPENSIISDLPNLDSVYDARWRF